MTVQILSKKLYNNDVKLFKLSKNQSFNQKI